MIAAGVGVVTWQRLAAAAQATCQWSVAHDASHSYAAALIGTQR